MRTLLIDGDVFCYQAASASEHEVHWCDEVSTLEGNLSESQATLHDKISEITSTLKADAVVIALSDPTKDYWRRQVLPTYKAHRTGRKPLVYWPLREWLEANYDCKTKPGLEGDDVLGILATHPTLIPGEKVIVSIDKDLQTIPGLLWRKGELVETDMYDADRHHMYQTLIGDTTDGYAGCPGVGPKTADKILDAAYDAADNSRPMVSFWWDAILKAYKKAGLGPEVALAQARVARILRASDYDFKTQTPILWTPPEETTKGTTN
jgi:5'-3' exonuclease